jgi:glycosyltransferase involved in cell wall biosynthesis
VIMCQLTIVVLAYNNARTIAAVLKAAMLMSSDIWVLDSGSTDATIHIASELGCKISFRAFDNFKNQRQYGLTLGNADYVFFIDSDEIASFKLIEDIRLLQSRGFDRDAYAVRRDWWALGKSVHALYPVKSPDYPVRILNRQVCHFNASKDVHESASGYAELGVLEGALEHHTFHSINEIFSKINTYTNLSSQDIVRKEKYWQWPLCIIFSPICAFIKWYFIKGGWRDGIVGIILALYAAAYSFERYRKALFFRLVSQNT